MLEDSTSLSRVNGANRQAKTEKSTNVIPYIETNSIRSRSPATITTIATPNRTECEKHCAQSIPTTIPTQLPTNASPEPRSIIFDSSPDAPILHDNSRQTDGLEDDELDVLTTTDPINTNQSRQSPLNHPYLSHFPIPEPRRPSAALSTTQSLSSSVDSQPPNVTGQELRQLAFEAWLQRVDNDKRTRQQVKKCPTPSRPSTSDLTKEEKQRNAEQVFTTWKRNKRHYFKQQLAKRRELELEEKRKRDEEMERRQSSEKAFEVWKSRKDDQLRSQFHSKQRLEREQNDRQQEEKEEKKARDQEAFDSWTVHKLSQIEQKRRKERVNQIKSDREREEEARQRSELAAEAYFKWELCKIATIEKSPTTSPRPYNNHYSPWRPPSSRSKR